MGIDCQAVRDVSIDFKQFVTDHRLTFVIVALGLFNYLLDYMQKHVVTKLSAYKHHSPETNLDLAIRCIQLFLGSIVGVTGYAMLLFNGSTGCNASEFQLLTTGGGILFIADLHEFVRRWPLPPQLLGHHVMVFFITLAIIEYYVIPPNFEDEISWSTTLIVSNIGFMWITDFFHVVFRVSTSLPFIEKAQKAYLVCSTIRPATFCLMIYGFFENIARGSVVGALPIFFMAIAYGYNSYKAITFVVRFDCEKYFMSHQAKWAEEKFTTEISKTDLRTKRISVHSSPISGKDLVSDGDAQSSVPSQRHSRMSMLGTIIAADMEEEEDQVQAGLRGAIEAEKELEEALLPLQRPSLFARHSTVMEDL